MTVAALAASDLGYQVVNGGFVPAPALALFGLQEKIPTLMVTGSHIPDDRNGIKFNKPTGEILKADESAMLAQSVTTPDTFDKAGGLLPGRQSMLPSPNIDVTRRYVRRWIDAVRPRALAGKRIVVYGHSAVGRDLLVEVYEALGAQVIKESWSQTFVPVDTEAIRPTDVQLAATLAKNHQPFAIVSTDGDADRPLISDENGLWLRGDVIGVIAAQWLGAEVVVTPVSSSTVVERTATFKKLIRTKIGSPYVIGAMQEAVEQGYRCVVGYEANGGFLTATSVTVPGGATLTPLPTRDPIIVQLGVLLSAAEAGVTVSEIMARLPARFTASDRLENFPTSTSQQHLADLIQGGPVAIEIILHDLIGSVAQVDTTDGLRVTGQSGDIVHLRSSGNAPELRCYAEADTSDRARELAEQVLSRCNHWRN
jgi:phosphomannomutase